MSLYKNFPISIQYFSKITSDDYCVDKTHAKKLKMFFDMMIHKFICFDLLYRSYERKRRSCEVLRKKCKLIKT